MKVLFLDTPLIFYFIPRIYPVITDTLTLKLRNESSNVEITPAVTFTISEKLEITITAQPTDFAIQNKYEVELKNGEDVIYRGKFIILAEDTDVQNYEYNTQPNAKFDYKED